MQQLSQKMLLFFVALSLVFTACEREETTNLQQTETIFQAEDDEEAGDLEERRTYYGDHASLGDGHMAAYAITNNYGRPREIGLIFTEEMLTNLPTSHSDMSHCYDVDGDGSYGPGECFMSHERVLALPDQIQRLTPFKWVLLNWNPVGHMPNGVYNVPHFDFHFYIQTLEERNDIKTGPCLNLMDCDDLATALNPIPPQYIPANYFYPPDGGTVEPAMGGHMIDGASPEICCMEPFTHTFIHGAYDGEITFYEPMATLELLNEKTPVNKLISLPDEWAIAGFYPTRYVIRYRPWDKTYKVALRGFRWRSAS